MAKKWYPILFFYKLPGYFKMFSLLSVFWICSHGLPRIRYLNLFAPCNPTPIQRMSNNIKIYLDDDKLIYDDGIHRDSIKKSVSCGLNTLYQSVLMCNNLSIWGSGALHSFRLSNPVNSLESNFRWYQCWNREGYLYVWYTIQWKELL